MIKISISTSGRNDLVDITSRVRRIAASENFQSGICTVFVPHTTAGVCINEAADPDVREDIISHLDKAVPWKSSYRHLEGNSAAHIKAVITGSSVTVPVEDGRLLLGTWQGIYFCEFDGPRKRNILVSLVSS